MKWLYDLSRQELGDVVKELGMKDFVSDQLTTWVFGKTVTDPESWRNISKENRQSLIKHVDFALNDVAEIERDPSGTAKFLIELRDGRRIEAVLIPEKNHYTFCISSQAGCALGCKFCATGNLGFKRNLTSGEIVSQVLLLKKELGDYSGKINLVFMGMGEPLLNYDPLKKALRLLTDERGVGISPRRITVSTAGILRNLKKLEDDFPNVKISFSLNGSDNDQRMKIMPISGTEPLENIIEYFRSRKRKHRITFEYVIMEGVNDSEADRDRILKLVRGIPSKINIIPYNPNDFAPFRTPSEKKIDEFAEYLAQKGMTVMVRWSKGRDIRSACGQLAGK